jgi:hypothetical protein
VAAFFEGNQLKFGIKYPSQLYPATEMQTLLESSLAEIEILVTHLSYKAVTELVENSELNLDAVLEEMSF